MASNVWTADRRLYLDKDGKVVEASDPDRASLLVNTGGTLPLEQAQALGLVQPAAAPQEAAQKLAGPPAANKAQGAPGENKAADDLGTRREGTRKP
jgi:enoyl-CoA hydratase/carnithine racemase